MPGILNYTTTIAVAKTVGEIQAMLGKARVSAVMVEYGPTGTPAALSFRITTAQGDVSFRMPARTDGVLKTLSRRGSKVPARLRNEEQAARVAWRIAKDWIEAQLAIVEADMADMIEVFLPFALNADRRTTYEVVRDHGFRGLIALPAPETKP